MNAQASMDHHAETAGWSEESCLTLALRFIDDQGLAPALEAFLANQVALERSMGDVKTD